MRYRDRCHFLDERRDADSMLFERLDTDLALSGKVRVKAPRVGSVLDSIFAVEARWVPATASLSTAPLPPRAPPH
jgi:hypothetical protein